MKKIPNPDEIFPNEYKTSCFIKNVITAPNIIVGDYTYYDDTDNPTDFEKNNVLFNYPEFGDHLIIGKFCQIASGTKFIMGPANHRLCARVISLSCSSIRVQPRYSSGSAKLCLNGTLYRQHLQPAIPYGINSYCFNLFNAAVRSSSEKRDFHIGS